MSVKQIIIGSSAWHVSWQVCSAPSADSKCYKQTKSRIETIQFAQFWWKNRGPNMNFYRFFMKYRGKKYAFSSKNEKKAGRNCGAYLLLPNIGGAPSLGLVPGVVSKTLVNRGAHEFLLVNEPHIFHCMGKRFCVEFQREPLKFHIKCLTHTLKETIFIWCWKFRSSQIYELVYIF